MRALKCIVRSSKRAPNHVRALGASLFLSIPYIYYTYLRIDPSMAVMCSSVKYPLLSSMSEDMRSLLGS